MNVIPVVVVPTEPQELPSKTFDEDDEEEEDSRFIRFKSERKEGMMMRFSDTNRERQDIPETLELSEEAKASLMKFKEKKRQRRQRRNDLRRGRRRGGNYGMNLRDRHNQGVMPEYQPMLSPVPGNFNPPPRLREPWRNPSPLPPPQPEREAFFIGERDRLQLTGNNDNLCCICMDAVIDTVLLECGHMVTCMKCGKRMSECPICRQYVVRAVHVFKS